MLSLFFIVFRISLIIEWRIILSEGVDILFSFYIDWMSLIFFGFISLISGSVFFYRGSYMKGEVDYRIFIMLVLMFVIRIFFLVFRLNLVRIMLGWDGLGVISYILVIFYKNEKSNRAGILTVLRNRVGDSALLLSIACILEFGRWNYLFFNFLINRFILWFIILAAITKRAQIPFSAWLPAAIAAPTPVSALVHSSTLVTAGVYLLIRFNEFLSDSLFTDFLFYLGVLTTVIARLTALFEVDFKKVVALSTLRQLGIIIRTLCLGYRDLAFIHLLTHAIFKALLFICRGKIIHNFEGGQDMRKIGGLIFNLPITIIIIRLTRFSLCGIPFLSGFYSKDLIIERHEMLDNFFFNYIVYIAVVGLSSSYSFRLIIIRGVGKVNCRSRYRGRDEDWVILSSKLGLIVMSVIRGSLLIWLVFPTPAIIRLTLTLKWLAFIRICLGVFLGVIICFLDLKGLIFIKNLIKIDMLIIIWNLPVLRGNIMGGLIGSMRAKFKKLDLGWLENLGGQGALIVLSLRGENWETWLINSIKKFLVVIIITIVRYIILLLKSF